MNPEQVSDIDHVEQITIRSLKDARRHPVPLKKLQKDVARKVEEGRVTRVPSVLAALVSAGASTSRAWAGS